MKCDSYRIKASHFSFAWRRSRCDYCLSCLFLFHFALFQKLKNIIKNVLEEKNVIETDTIYSACFKNLFNVSMVLLKVRYDSAINTFAENLLRSHIPNFFF